MITHIDQFLFVFCLLYAKLGTEKASNLEIPVSTHTKKPTKMYLSLGKKQTNKQTKNNKRDSLTRQKTCRQQPV